MPMPCSWCARACRGPTIGSPTGLPGAAFVVNGAARPPNSALTTVGAELHVTLAVSVLAKFDGEFGKGAQTYTRSAYYTW